MRGFLRISQFLLIIFLFGITPALCRLACALPLQQSPMHSCCDHDQPSSKTPPQNCCSIFTGSTSTDSVKISPPNSLELLPVAFNAISIEPYIKPSSELLLTDQTLTFQQLQTRSSALGANAPPATLIA